MSALADKQESASDARGVLNKVMAVIAMTDPESDTFVDSGADCLDALVKLQPEIETALAAADPKPTAAPVQLLRECLEVMERIQGARQTQYEQDRALGAAIAKLRSAAGVLASGEPDVDAVLSAADVHTEESREDGRRVFDRGGLVAFARDIRCVAAAPAAKQSTCRKGFRTQPCGGCHDGCATAGTQGSGK